MVWWRRQRRVDEDIRGERLERELRSLSFRASLSQKPMTGLGNKPQDPSRTDQWENIVKSIVRHKVKERDKGKSCQDYIRSAMIYGMQRQG